MISSILKTAGLIALLFGAWVERCGGEGEEFIS